MMLNPELLKAIRQSYNGLYRVNSIGHIGFTIIGLAIIVASFFIKPPSSPVFVFCIGFVLAAIGLGCMLHAKKKRVDLVDLLQNSPHKIVWIYRQVNTGKAYGVTVAQFEFIVFGLYNKQRVQVRLPKLYIQMLLQQLPTVLGHVTLGYSSETLQAFNQDPLNLVQDFKGT